MVTIAKTKQPVRMPRFGHRVDRTDPILRGLVGWWPLNDGAGTKAKDLVGGGNDGTLNSNVAWGTSSVGTVAVFNDSLVSQITVPYDSSYNAATTGEISVSAWVKVDATRGDHSIIIGKDDNDSNREWLISYLLI